MLNTDEIMYAHWCLSDNFGDKLTPYIVEKVSGKKCVWSPKESDIEKYVVTGSILNWEIENAIAWGAGIASKDDNIAIKNIVMVRGEISKYRAILSGIENEIAVGDPALLLPRYYTTKIKKKYKLGIFPHYIDTDVVAYNLLSQLPDDVVLIYALDDIEKTIDLICSCERVISSSLHGLIVADAYRIPSKWVKFSDRILGDGTKYMDYYSSIGYDIGTKPTDLRSDITIDAMLSVECDLKKLKINLNKMIECCPFLPKINIEDEILTE
jgi:pyruvyltransferase